MARECAMASCSDTGVCSPSTRSQSNPDQPSASVALTELSIDQMPISGRPPFSAARNGLGGRLFGSTCVKTFSSDEQNGGKCLLMADANQGWRFDDALK